MDKKVMDLSKMNVLEMPERKNAGMEVRVNGRGELALGSTLFKKLFQEGKGAFVKYFYTDDYRVIAIQPGEEGDFRFPKSGMIKHQKYANKLEALGYRLPAKYSISWNEEVQAWVGELQEVSPAPLPGKKRRGNGTKSS